MGKGEEICLQITKSFIENFEMSNMIIDFIYGLGGKIRPNILHLDFFLAKNVWNYRRLGLYEGVTR